MIQKRICKSKRIFLSFISPLGTCKVSQQKSPMCQGKNSSSNKSTVFYWNGKWYSPIQVGIEPSISVINYELDANERVAMGVSSDVG